VAPDDDSIEDGSGGRRFEGWPVLVTGGGSGIGRATVQRVAAEGAAVAVLDLVAENAEAVADEARGLGATALALPVDVADDEAVGGAVHRATAELGRLRGVVTSAGIFHGPDLAPLHEVEPTDFRRVLDVNLGGTFSTLRHALPLLADGGGAAVTIASTAALRGHGYGPGYTASKGGVDALTRLAAVQYGEHGVRVNCVCPGGTDTPMTGGVFATPEARARARHIPLRRYAAPEEIAAVVAFLLSDDASYVTGHTFPVEGGALAT
jgi:NAD(P)-dependent dehydrogenase (short-subunit alcohol dehydrogenase family)